MPKECVVGGRGEEGEAGAVKGIQFLHICFSFKHPIWENIFFSPEFIRAVMKRITTYLFKKNHAEPHTV